MTSLRPISRSPIARWVAAVALAGACATAIAQAPPPPLEPLPEPPPPPAGAVDPSLEPQVTITQRDGDTYEEVRVAGRLVLVKVTPRTGIPYYLIDELGDGRFVRRAPHESNLRVPLWLLFSF